MFADADQLLQAILGLLNGIEKAAIFLEWTGLRKGIVIGGVTLNKLTKNL
jgi:hypothetical protein